MITIVDYGMGNLGSVVNMLKRIGVNSIITSDTKQIMNAEKIILPGVGAFDAAIKRIDELDLRETLVNLALINKTPILGICLGMQLLMDNSEEGSLLGLGLIKGKVIGFKNQVPSRYKIPHMGWNEVILKKESPLTFGFNEETRFYFVHSYYVKVDDESNTIMKCKYGIDFDAAIHNKNIYGAQFHPEKSHKFGMQFLKNFASF